DLQAKEGVGDPRYDLGRGEDHPGRASSPDSGRSEQSHPTSGGKARAKDPTRPIRASGGKSRPPPRRPQRPESVRVLVHERVREWDRVIGRWRQSAARLRALWECTMSADGHLLFGLLALQTGLIRQEQLVAAFHAWTGD